MPNDGRHACDAESIAPVFLPKNKKNTSFWSPGPGVKRCSFTIHQMFDFDMPYGSTATFETVRYDWALQSYTALVSVLTVPN